jgi:hypothetical protein
LLGLLFDPEDRGDMFLRNVRLSPNNMALQLEDRTLHSNRRENQIEHGDVCLDFVL